MSDMLTTANAFPNEDVTHKPKRKQRDNLKKYVETSPDVESQSSDVPSVLTIERAIKYYESHAEGDLYALYTQTANWLRTLLSRKSQSSEVLDTLLENCEDSADSSEVE